MVKEPTPTNPFSAFSLIELLAVVAIVGVLATLLVPVTQKVIGNARGSKCLSNLRQLGVGWHAYATDHDGRLPSVGWKNAGNNPDNPGIRDYVGLPSVLGSDPWRRATVFTCPELQANPSTRTEEALFRTYSVNQLAADVYSGIPPAGLKKKLTAIQRPSQFAVAMDGICDLSRPANDRYSTMVRNFGGTPLDQIQRPHAGKTAVLFADGHTAHADSVTILDTSPNSVFWRDPG